MASVVRQPYRPGVEVDGWLFERWQLQKEKQKPDGTIYHQPMLSFYPVPTVIYRDEDGQVRGFRISFIFRGSPPDENKDKRVTDVDIPARIVRSPTAANIIAEAGGPDLSRDQAQTIVRLLTDVIAGRGNDKIEEREVVTRCTWDDRGHLSGPGLDGRPVGAWLEELAAYGRCTEISEEDARRAWAFIAKNAQNWPKAMIVYGMPLGSLYTVPFGKDSFSLHLTAESSVGKTESAEIAMSTLSSAQRPHGALYRTWDASAQAPINLLKMVGALPVWFDETAVMSGDDEEFTNLIFRLSQGRARLVANTEGGLRDGSGERWDSCILSTGEARITFRSGLTGIRRRVIELSAPLIPSADIEMHEAFIARARAAHGWPLRWFMRDHDVVAAANLHATIFGRLGEIARNQQVEVSQAYGLATCAVGFAELCRLAGVPVNESTLIWAASEAFSEVLSAAEDEGASISERGIAAILEAVETTDNFVNPEDDFAIDRWGVRFPDGYIGVLGKHTLRTIFKTYADLADPVPVLNRWKAEGILQHDSSSNQGRREIYSYKEHKIVSKRMYLIRVDDKPDP